MKTSVKSICAAIAATIAVSAFAAVPSSITKFVPEYINYQGYLANPATGAAYTDGLYTIQCRLYREASGGTAIWGAKYSVYVKDGYFNIMLGDNNAAELNYTYKKNELWRALWYDTAASERNNLWLGVTPEQNATHATITSPTEISPRQQLLAAPYAFRAQAAEYAEQSIGAFKVNGALTVSGSATFSTDFTVPSRIKSDGSYLYLGGTTSSANSANPIVYNVGRYQYFRPYYSWTVSPTAGDVTFTIPSGKSFTVSTTTNKMTSTVTQMKSTGVTTIEASSLTLKSTGTTALDAGTSLYLYPATNRNVYGQGHVYWKTPGLTANLSPIKLMQKKVTLSGGAMYGSVQIASRGQSDYDNYVWTVAGYQQSRNGGLSELRCYDTNDGSVLTVRFVDPQYASNDVTVDLLGIHRAFLYDAR